MEYEEGQYLYYKGQEIPEYLEDFILTFYNHEEGNY